MSTAGNDEAEPRVSASVYRAWVCEGYEQVVPRGSWSQVIHQAAGSPQPSAWDPPSVDLLTESADGSPRHHADAPYLGSMMAWRDQAWEAVADHLLPWGQALPLACPQAPLVAFNALQVVDALDEEGSHLRRFSDGRVMRIDRWAFRADRLPPDGLFRVPQKHGFTLCTGRTAEWLIEQQVAGLALDRLWSGDAAPADQP